MLFPRFNTSVGQIAADIVIPDNTRINNTLYSRHTPKHTYTYTHIHTQPNIHTHIYRNTHKMKFCRRLKKIGKKYLPNNFLAIKFVFFKYKKWLGIVNGRVHPNLYKIYKYGVFEFLIQPRSRVRVL